MRDVTDNVTGELDVEVKRGRGRPRKEGALTNAQRQAAFRARRRADSVTPAVTKKPRLVVDQVDAYDECRLEVDRLREDLKHELDIRQEYIDSNQEAFAEIKRLREEVAELKKKGAAKSVTTSNGNPVSFDDMVELILLASKARTFEQRMAIRKDEAGVFWRGLVRKFEVNTDQVDAVGKALLAGKL
ncbi:hypothetical protein HpMS107_51410 [Helicobacter pylori]